MMQWLWETVWLVPLYPLIGAALALPLGVADSQRRIGARPAGYICILTTIVAFGHSIAALAAGVDLPARELHFTWLQAAGLTIDLPLVVNMTALTAIVVVTGLNLLGQIYAVGYLEMDWGWPRFFALMGLFEAGISSLALCNSLFFSYIFLEILTLATYLLVGFWFAQPLVMTGARDAFWTKRVGDLILFIGTIALYPLAGTWNFTELATWADTVKISPLTANLLCFALIAGPLAKCAQIPFQLWLDEAMEGPVPATILRNSVVVGAGAFVLLRLQPVIELSPLAINTLLCLGILTAISSSCIAIAQIDIKRVLSYSVSAYIGIVFIAIGTGRTEIAAFLLFNESFGIGLLYMCTGAIIWTNITQDVTQLGGLWKKRPFMGIAYVLGAASLLGLPPFGGFWGTLESIDSLWEERPFLVGVVLAVNCILSFSYTRMFCAIFLGKAKPMSERSPEVLWPMFLPTIVLTATIVHTPIVFQKFGILPNWEELNHSLAIVLTCSTIFGVILGSAIYVGSIIPKPVVLPIPKVQEFFARDLYFADIYRLTIAGTIKYAALAIEWCDRYIVDGAVNLLGFGTLLGSETLKYSTSGKSQFYVLVIFTFVVLLGVIFGVVL
jgi:NAD(P)H-quinone oxidoreductase subunit 5